MMSRGWTAEADGSFPETLGALAASSVVPLLGAAGQEMMGVHRWVDVGGDQAAAAVAVPGDR